MKRLLSISLFVLLPVIVACSPSASTPAIALTTAPAAQPPSAPDSALPSVEGEPDSAEADTVNTSADSPLWQTMALTNARTGESFTLADFAGKTVYVEPMATWCTTCRQQLNNLRAAQGELDSENIVLVALSVETNVTAEQLAQYADNNDFNWTFAVLTPELLTELVNQFGRAITSPPSTPHFIIRADGTTTELSTGIKSSETLVALLQAESQ